MRLTDLIHVTIFTGLSLTSRRQLWGIVSLAFSLTLFFINLLVLTFFLYFAGLIVVGKKQALFSDAFVISLLGTALSTLFLMFIPYPLISLFLFIFVWLLLIKRFYETGWLGAIAVAILIVLVFLGVTIILALLFGLLEAISKLLFSSLVSFL
ncbi:hypothetical protein E3J49_01710 [Candidatus Bathyarchaeota archaeon]|nr:MAG: hypothetical protein E3J49_01710 [Candidatus Bathyarchaeota archaeon]